MESKEDAQLKEELIANIIHSTNAINNIKELKKDAEKL